MPHFINPDLSGDYHMHTINYSDWFNTIDEMVIQAWKIWLKKIAITDHSRAHTTKKWIPLTTFRESWIPVRRQNIHNDVEVEFGVEGDLLNNQWDVCLDIQHSEWWFTLLSVHKLYQDLEEITKAYINAIEKHHAKIDCIGHPDFARITKHMNIKKVADCCNAYNLPIEFNCANFVNWTTDMKACHTFLRHIDTVYINSDAHTLYELSTLRKKWINRLIENWYLEEEHRI